MMKEQTSIAHNSTSSEIAPPLPSGKVRPMGTCLLVEYRLSARSRLERFISSTRLFENVEESASIHACLAAVLKSNVDVCVFGPSVKIDKIREFLDRLSDSNKARPCAVIATRWSSAADSIEGVHSVLDFPCSQGTFNAGVVQALTRANDGNLPEVCKTDPSTGKAISLKDSLNLLEFPDNQSADHVIRDSRPSIWPRETFEVVLKRSSQFKEKVADLQPFNLRFRSDGSPTEFTSEIILTLLNSVFPDSDEIPGMSKFKLVLEELLYKWAQIGAQLGRRTADTCLKREIINCFGMNIQ